MGKNYEIKNINGEDVFVAKINENFWLFNDVCVCVASDWVYNEDDVLVFLSLKDDAFFSYNGVSEKQFVYMFKEGDCFRPTLVDFSFYSEQVIVDKILEVYNDYKEWAGLKN